MPAVPIATTTITIMTTIIMTTITGITTIMIMGTTMGMTTATITMARFRQFTT